MYPLRRNPLQMSTALEPAPRGNDRAVTHGAYAALKLGGRVDELADALRPQIPAFDEVDDVALRVLSLALARLERAAEALEANSKATELERLRQDARGWANTVLRYCDALGMTPTARARLGLTLVRARELTEEQARPLPTLRQGAGPAPRPPPEGRGQ